MLCKQLIEILSLNPDGRVRVVHKHIISEDTYVMMDATVVTDGDDFIIAAAMFYDRRAAVRELAPRGKLQKTFDWLSDDYCTVYID